MEENSNNPKISMRSFFFQHPTLIITLIYVFLNLISFITNQRYYSRYQIDYSKYVEINDLLFGILKIERDLPFLLVIPILLIVTVLVLLLRYNSRKGESSIWTHTRMRMFVAIFFVIVICFYALQKLAEYDTKNDSIVVWLKPTKTNQFERPVGDTLTLLGTTDRYHLCAKVIEFDTLESLIKYQPLIIPNVNIHKIEYLEFPTLIKEKSN